MIELHYPDINMEVGTVTLTPGIWYMNYVLIQEWALARDTVVYVHVQCRVGVDKMTSQII